MALGDQRDGGQAPHLLLGHLEQVHAIQLHSPAFDPAWWTDQPHEGQRDRRFARAGLADQTEAFVRE